MPTDDTLLSDAFGPIDPVWTVDETADAATRYVDVSVTELYRDRLFGKPRGVQVDQGTSSAKIRASLFAPGTGAPLVIDVGQYSTPPTVEARYREASGLTCGTTDAAGSLSSDGTTVAVDLPNEIADAAGVFTLQWRVVDGGGTERVRNECWVVVDRGAWTTSGTAPNEEGPPTTREIRGLIRDHPGANRLLGEYEFDVAEIAQGIVSAVQMLDATYPQTFKRFPTTKWPAVWRRPLLDGIMSYLFMTASDYHRRGMLPYSAGGVSVNDLNKEADYTRAAEMYRTRFEQWCKFVKTRASVMAGFGSTGSGYPGGAIY